MQVNRLNHLIFPPGTPHVTGGLLDAADTVAQDATGADTAASSSAASRSHRSAVTPQATVPSAQVPTEAGVKLDLDHSQRAQAAVTYGPDGLFGGKSSIEVANTPAEQFVATAVEIMRNYQQEHAQPAAYGALDRLKQAVASRFSAVA